MSSPGVILMRQRTACLVLLLALAAGSALAQGAAIRIGALQPDNWHGIGFLKGDDVAYSLRVLATGGNYRDWPAGGQYEGIEPVGPATEAGNYCRQGWTVSTPLADNFSVRWTAALQVPQTGRYTFYLASDDGARLVIDDEMVIEAWYDRSGDESVGEMELTAGEHALRCEYYERGGGAQCHLAWSGPGVERQMVGGPVVASDGRPGLKAQYFSSTALEGEPLEAHVEKVDFDWGEGGPQVGDGDPPVVVLEWTRMGEGAVVGRVRAPRGAYVGLMLGALQTRNAWFWDEGGILVGSVRTGHDEDLLGFRLRSWPQGLVEIRGGVPHAGLWVPATEPVCFLAGFMPLPEVTPAEIEAELAKVRPAG